MSKLLKLKEWLTVDDTAQKLSISTGEEVSEADVLRLALDGHLTLSVYFVNHARGTPGEIVSFEETNWYLMPPLRYGHSSLPIPEQPPEECTSGSAPMAAPRNLQKLFTDNPEALISGHLPVMKSLKIDEDRYLNLGENVETLRGVWDLPMWGAEALDVEHLYQSLVGGPAVTLTNLEGAFVQGTDGFVYQLKDSWEDNEYQAGSNAQLEEIKQRIYEDEISPEKAKALLEKHAENRKIFLAETKSRNESGRNHENYYPAGAIPSDSIFVVRTSALRELEEKLLADDTPPEKPLHQSERRSIAQIICTLSAMAKIDLSKPYAADEVLRLAAATHGIELPSSPETVAKFLKDAATRAGKT